MEQLDAHLEKHEPSFLAHMTNTKINLKCNTDLNVKAKTIKLIEKKYENPHDFGTGKDSSEYKEIKYKRKNWHIVLHQNYNILLFKRHY